MPEYLTDADLVQQPQSDFLTEADLVAPVKVGKKVVKKKVAKPSVGALREQAAGTKAPTDTSMFEGHNWEVEGGQPQIQMQVKPSTSLDFRSPEVSLTTATPKLKLTPTQAKRREGESFDEFNIRASQFESAKKQQLLQEKAERAAVRSKVAPNQGLGKYPIAAAQGVGNVLSPLIRQGGLAAGIGPEETWDQQMPVLNQEEARQWSTKVAEGLGSTIPFALTSAMTGTVGTALLGASSNAAQTYEEALANGVSHDQALQAAIPGAIIGSLEGLMGLGTGKFFEQMGKGTASSFIAGIGEEELQELFTQAANNVNAKMLSGYDPKRAIHEGMWDTFVTTLGTAGLAHGATLGGSHGNSHSNLLVDNKDITVAYRDGKFDVTPHKPLNQIDPRQLKAVNDLMSGFATREEVPVEMQQAAAKWAQDGGLAQPTLATSPSFLLTELQQMEQRALKAGKPVALRPETRDAYVARNQEIKQQLMTLDPASPDFAKLADEHTRLARAIDDAPETVPESTEALRKHLVEKNLGHEGAADEMLGILRPSDTDGIADHPAELAARFYPNKTSDTKGGTVYLSPEVLGNLFIESEGARSGIGALNENVDKVREVAARVSETDPALSQSLFSAADEAERKGLSQVSLISYRQGQGLPVTRKLIRHESFHTGQWGALDQVGEGPDIRALHSPDVIYHPVLAKMASTETGQQVLNYYGGDHDALATELAAYSAAGQYDLFGLSEEDAASYLTDYLTGIAETHGPEALDALAGTARLSPTVAQKVKEISSESKPKNFGQANRDFAAQLRAQPSASGRVEGTTGSGEDSGNVESGRVAEAPDQAEASGVAGGPPTNETGGAGSEGSGGGNLYVNVLSSDVVKEYAKKSGQALHQLGWNDPNSLLSPTEQILKVLRERPDLAEPAVIGQALREKGVNGGETLKQLDETVTNAAKTLQAVQAADAEWQQLIKEFPKVAAELGKAGVGPSPNQMARTVEKEVQAAFKDVQASVLGRDLWRRSGDLYRKTLLTRFSTGANNAVSTVPRIPLDLVDGAMTGTAMGMLDPEKWAGKSDATLAEGAKAGALAGMQASMRVAMAFPGAAKRLLRRADPAHEFNETVIAQMEQLHPDLHSKLAGRSTGLDDLAESKVNLDKVRELLPYLNDADKIKEYNAKLALYQKRFDFNQKWAGKLFDKTNWMYDQFLKPGNIQEFFFRRPYFVGRLVTRAADAGFNLNELVENSKTLSEFAKNPAGKDAVAITQLPTLADLPPEVWEAAADDALTFTYAYAPKIDKGRVEKFSAHYIEFMDSMGPIGAVVDAFPKALYNGLKFAYEYSPVGAIRPIASISSDASAEGRKGIKYDDVSRVSKAVLGTAMYAAALMVRRELGGEEWWQIKTGKKDKKGQPIYFNAKKLMPFAGFLYVADVIDRWSTGRLGDKKPLDDAAELYFGARRTDSRGAVFADALKQTSDYWAFDMPVGDRLVQAAKKPFGEILGAPLTPFINIRDLIAQFDEDEAAKRDMKERPLLGPAIDKLPWLRSSEKYGLPLYQPPTEPAPQPSSAAPALTEVGVSLDPGTNFATREFSRLGISPIRWLKPDPDPKINRAQYAAYAKRLALIAPKIEASPLYQSKTDAQKAAFWEAKLSGPDGLAAEAKELGQQANPQEINRREILKSQPPLQRKASGLDKKVQEMKNTPVP